MPRQPRERGQAAGGKTRKGSTWLRRALTEAARGAARTKRAGRTALARQYRGLVVRRGKQKAAIAVGHRILLLAYHLLLRREDYQELAPADLEARRRSHLQNKALRQLRQLGFEVTLTPKAEAA